MARPAAEAVLPPDYAERVYAGVLGKVIGVYLGRPFENWRYERIMKELGEIRYYVHERLSRPLVVTDDDISGTFTFLRALPDYGNDPDITPQQIGQTWLNYIIEGRTTLWWGGLGNSTEHTAYLRLKRGIPAPQSGSIAQNGKVVAEQIGAQIFIDGWAMVAPGRPDLAADLARRAASVSHDGEAVHAAQLLAAMEAQAFVEQDLDALIDTGLSFIPNDSVIYRMISDIREWHRRERDWRRARALLEEHYGYDKYGGNCHVVPNHGVIILSLLYGGGDFHTSLAIANTCGWDTDCNSGNLGCLLGIRNGLAGIEDGPDWRGPVADRLYVPSADGGRAITDAVWESLYIVNIGRALVGLGPVAPKSGARFHFELPGSVQGFRPDDSPEARGVALVANVQGHSQEGTRSLKVSYHHLAAGRVGRVGTPTFIPPEAWDLKGYALIASPTLYSGQLLRARVAADPASSREVTCRLYLRVYGKDDQLELVPGPEAALSPGADHIFEWRIPDTGGAPIAEVGIEVQSQRRADGALYLDWLTWDGPPDVLFARPPGGGQAWLRAWVSGVDACTAGGGGEVYRLIHGEGTGLMIQGTREWTDYRVSATVTPHMVRSAGIGARVQGMRRYYALLLAPEGRLQLVKALDGIGVLAERTFDWRLGATYSLALEARGRDLRAFVDGELLLEATDGDRPLEGGAVAMICEEGRTAFGPVRVQPAAGSGG